MITKLPRFFISAAVLTLFLSFGANLRAQPAASGNSGPTVKSSASGNSSAATGLLSQAYAALSGADHDYQGHRIRAMRQIEAAAKELGVNLQGDSSGQEQQGASDQQLHTAQSLLQQALTGLPEKAKRHVERAIEQLSVALSIK
jgi:hypothetical protein